MTSIFKNRAAAGQALATRLQAYSGRADTIVVALPRGGVPVAFEVAKALKAPLDILVVRKLGVPGQAEYAMGAIAAGGVCIVNEEVVAGLGIPRSELERVVAEERLELERRALRYRGHRPALDVRGLTVILVDDGLATGSTMRAAVVALRKQDPARIIAAVPVGASDVCHTFETEVDEIICLETPEPFRAVSCWYADFSQTGDAEVQRLLAQAGHARTGRG